MENKPQEKEESLEEKAKRYALLLELHSITQGLSFDIWKESTENLLISVTIPQEEDNFWLIVCNAYEAEFKRLGVKY